jgi:hypothetical protein
MFELTIKCTKDIDEIHINFADGSSVITGGDKSENPDKNKDLLDDSDDSPSSATSKKTKMKSNAKKPKPEEFMDLEADFDQVSQEVVELPNIDTEKRSIKVASELQNLDI